MSTTLPARPFAEATAGLVVLFAGLPIVGWIVSAMTVWLAPLAEVPAVAWSL